MEKNEGGAVGWESQAAEHRIRNNARLWCTNADCATSQSTCMHWTDSNSYVLALASHRNASSRIHVLRSLSAFLLCVGSGKNISFCSKDYSVSTFIGRTCVSIKHSDVANLYEMLFLELSQLSDLLSEPCFCSKEHCVAKCNQLVEMATPSQLGVIIQSLCCSIRIIPVFDMFDTSLSQKAITALNALLHQLCTLDRLSQYCHNQSAYDETTRPSCYTDNSRLLTFETIPKGGFECHIFIRCSLLEVFLNEVIAHPDIGHHLLQDNETNLLVREELLSGLTKHAEASLEIASVHMVLHLMLKTNPNTTSPFQQSFATHTLTILSAVLLLDLVSKNEIPDSLLIHVLSLVASAIDFSEDKKDSPFDHFLGSNDMSPAMVLGLALSTVETAAKLMVRVAPLRGPRCRESICKGDYSHYHDDDRLSNNWRFFGGTPSYSSKGLASNDRNVLYSIGRTSYLDYSRKVHDYLLAAILHVMECALSRVLEELIKLEYSCTNCGKNCTTLSRSSICDLRINSMVDSLAMIFSTYVFKRPEGFEYCDTKYVIGQSLLYFCSILGLQCDLGSKEMLHVPCLNIIKSLTSLLLFRGNSGNGGPSFNFDSVMELSRQNFVERLNHGSQTLPICKAGKTTPRYFLHTMVKMIQEPLWELQLKQTFNTKFLVFLLKHVPLADGLDVATTGLGKCLDVILNSKDWCNCGNCSQQGCHIPMVFILISFAVNAAQRLPRLHNLITDGASEDLMQYLKIVRCLSLFCHIYEKTTVEQELEQLSDILRGVVSFVSESLEALENFSAHDSGESLDTIEGKKKCHPMQLTDFFAQVNNFVKLSTASLVKDKGFWPMDLQEIANSLLYIVENFMCSYSNYVLKREMSPVNHMSTCKDNPARMVEDMPLAQTGIVVDKQDIDSPVSSFCRPRPSTIAIIKRFMRKRQHLCFQEAEQSCITSHEGSPTPSKRQRKQVRGTADRPLRPLYHNVSGRKEATPQSRNSYIQEILSNEPNAENDDFSDLNDFIVYKEGRNYTKFLNKRLKFRRRSHTRMIWKRLEEKRTILHMLDLYQNKEAQYLQEL